MSSIARARPDGRRFPRLAVVNSLRGYIVSLQTPMTALDLSDGGFAMITGFALPEGSVHRFTFRVGQGRPVVLTAQVVYSREAGGGDGRFLTGLRFLGDRTAVETLIDAVTAHLTFDPA